LVSGFGAKYYVIPRKPTISGDFTPDAEVVERL
jgi:hypothetical protein